VGPERILLGAIILALTAWTGYYYIRFTLPRKLSMALRKDIQDFIEEVNNTDCHKCGDRGEVLMIPPEVDHDASNVKSIWHERVKYEDEDYEPEYDVVILLEEPVDCPYCSI